MLEKQHLMLQTIMLFCDLAVAALEKGVGIEAITGLDIRDEISRMKYIDDKTFDQEHTALTGRLKDQFNSLGEAA